MIKVYSLGYQGISQSEYIGSLVANGIGILLDVREVAWSYKPGFSKSQLQKALSSVNIEYIHLKSAGNPSEIRKNANTQEECLRSYRLYLQNNSECLYEIIDIVLSAKNNGKKVCLTCFEKQPEDCHRSILMEALETLNPGIDSIHLFGECCLLD